MNTIENMKDDVLLTVFDLAHENGLTIKEFLAKITSENKVDKSHLPRNSDNEIVYENGDVGIDLDLDDETKLILYTRAMERDITSNALIVEVITKYANKVIEEAK